MRSLASVLLATTLVTGCVLPPARLSPNGRSTVLHVADGQVHGELIAVTPDTVWLLTQPGGVPTPFSANSVVRLDVQRHRMGGTRTIQIMSVVGTATGALLMVACGQVDDASCGAVLPATLLTYLGLGALFAVVNSHSAWMSYTPAQFMVARPYTRFPQGMPDTLRTAPRPSSP